LSEKLNLSEKLKSLEVLVSPDSLKLLQMLFGEMNSCSTDLESLVTNCIDIYKGRNVDVCSLLGVSNSGSRSMLILFFKYSMQFIYILNYSPKMNQLNYLITS
jgi:hypothetical protein